MERQCPSMRSMADSFRPELAPVTVNSITLITPNVIMKKWPECYDRLRCPPLPNTSPMIVEFSLMRKEWLPFWGLRMSPNGTVECTTVGSSMPAIEHSTARFDSSWSVSRFQPPHIFSLFNRLPRQVHQSAFTSLIQTGTHYQVWLAPTMNSKVSLWFAKSTEVSHEFCQFFSADTHTQVVPSQA